MFRFVVLSVNNKYKVVSNYLHILKVELKSLYLSYMEINPYIKNFSALC